MIYLILVFVSLSFSTKLLSQDVVSPYQGQETRQIKALSESEISSLLTGEGMGFAKAAELNHYPGPKHVLEFAGQLGLSGEQTQKTQAAFDAMHAEAVQVGAVLVQKEASLDSLFANGEATSESLNQLLDEIAELQSKLRFAHLSAHLQMREVLTPKQIAQYNQLRGYHTHSHQNHNQHHQH